MNVVCLHLELILLTQPDPTQLSYNQPKLNLNLIISIQVELGLALNPIQLATLQP